MFLLPFLVMMVTASASVTEPQNHLQLTTKPINLDLPEVIKDEKVHLIEFRDLTLNCTCPPPSSSVAWSKNGSPLEAKLASADEEDNQNSLNSKLHKSQSQLISDYKIITTDPTLSQLVVEKANSTDIGDYECRTALKPAEILHRFIVRAKPRVKFNLSSPFAPSQTVELGSPWAVNCEFASTLYSLNASIALLRCGQIKPQVKKGDTSNLWCGRPSLAALQADTRAWVAASSGRVRIRQSKIPFTSVSISKVENDFFVLSNSTAVSLSVRAVRFEDVGYYLCAAENSMALSEAVVLLRVVDRYEAAWPAILLLGLGLYLFSLVMVFESRRYLATNFLKLDVDNKVN